MGQLLKIACWCKVFYRWKHVPSFWSLSFKYSIEYLTSSIENILSVAKQHFTLLELETCFILVHKGLIDRDRLGCCKMARGLFLLIDCFKLFMWLPLFLCIWANPLGKEYFGKFTNFFLSFNDWILPCVKIWVFIFELRMWYPTCGWLWSINWSFFWARLTNSQSWKSGIYAALLNYWVKYLCNRFTLFNVLDKWLVL